METTTDPNSCASFVWHSTTKVRCHTCGVPRGQHIGGYISQGPSDPGLTAYLSQPCDDCSATATHNGRSKVDGRRGQFCNAHTDWAHPSRSRDD